MAKLKWMDLCKSVLSNSFLLNLENSGRKPVTNRRVLKKQAHFKIFIKDIGRLMPNFFSKVITENTLVCVHSVKINIIILVPYFRNTVSNVQIIFITFDLLGSLRVLVHPCFSL